MELHNDLDENENEKLLSFCLPLNPAMFQAGSIRGLRLSAVASGTSGFLSAATHKERFCHNAAR
jgi:hypothetical protein